MENFKKYREDSLDYITQKIDLIGLIAILIITVLLLVMARFLYSFLDYIPLKSITALLSITAALVFLGFLLVKTFSKKAVTAIKEYNKKLHVMLDTAKKIHEIIYSDALLDGIMDVSMDITGADAGSVLLLEGENLVFRKIKGKEVKNLTGASFPKSGGIAGLVVERGETIRIEDATKDKKFLSEIDKITVNDTKSLLSVPLKSNKGVIGVLELVNRRDGPFSIEDGELILYFAEQAAISFERAKFFEDEKNYQIHITNILIDAMENMPEKRGHSRRIAKYTMLMAHALNMTESEKKKMYYSSFLHDIGFLKIKQKDSMSAVEYQKHPEIGYQMLLPINFYAEIAPIVLYHHERYDGNGYPSGLKGKDIPRESMMIYIAEAFDAISSKYSYKILGKIIDQNPSFFKTGFQYAVEELKSNAGSQFDPELIEIFLNNISEDYIEQDEDDNHI